MDNVGAADVGGAALMTAPVGADTQPLLFLTVTLQVVPAVTPLKVVLLW
jgi:hypothetical protein